MTPTFDKTKKLVLSALFAALTCISTMVIAIPTPTNGYIHPGDGFVILSGIFLGPIWGGIAAGVGSMLADLLLGYASYAPATFLIKMMAALLSGMVYSSLMKTKGNRFPLLPVVILSGILSGAMVICGYFSFEATVLGYGLAAAAGIPVNLLQSGFGMIVSTVMVSILSKVPVFKSILH